MPATKKKGYPLLPVKHWWTLRDRFRASIPGTVSTNYLSSVLGMAETSAQNNILPSLRSMSLVDDNLKPSDLAVRWRDDTQYPEVCEEIQKAVYPKGLRDIGTDSATDRDAVSRWLANHTGAGANAVNKMAAMYLLLCRKDPSESKPAPAGKKSTPRKVQSSKAPVAPKPDTPAQKPGRSPVAASEATPPLHINVQVHISSDATPDQIDLIFESMAKHLYRNK